VADVLSSGPEPGGPSRPRRRWTTPLAGVLVAAAAAYLAVQAGGSTGAGRPSAADSSRDVRVRPAPQPTPTGPPPPIARYRLDGVPGVGPAGVRMLVGGRNPGVLDAGTGRLAALPFTKGLGEVAELDHAGGTTTVLLHNPNRLRARAVVLDRGGRVTRLGQVLDVLPMRDGTVLAEDCEGAVGAGPCTLTGYAATGAVRWKRSVPGQLDLVRDTSYGLLVRAYQGGAGGMVRLEDPRSGALYRVIGRTYAVLGADDRQVAFVPAACGSDCGLTLADLTNGASRFLPEIPGNPSVAAFSRDGQRLAIGYAGMLPDDPSTSPQRDGYVAVLDLDPSVDHVQLVPRLTTGPASTALPVWSPDGRLLLAVPTDGAGSGRVVAWTPGTPRVTILPAGLTGFYGTPGYAAALS
jgi:hypothetical protein